MDRSKYFSLAGCASERMPAAGPEASVIEVVRMDQSMFPGCMYNKAGWIYEPMEEPDFIKHDSDKLLVFIGSDTEDPENLNAEIELWIENDKLVLTKTCIVFVPAGAGHGRLKVKSLNKPVLQYCCLLNTDTYAQLPARATSPAGTFAKNAVEKYAPVDGKLPTAPGGFLTLLLWIDGKKLQGAPYMEAVWFKTSNNTGPEKHTHDFDEFIGFIGSDPANPCELGAKVEFYIDDEKITITKSCLVYIPRGVEHSPILVPRLDRPIIHFSGGNGGDYVREGSDKF